MASRHFHRIVRLEEVGKNKDELLIVEVSGRYYPSTPKTWHNPAEGATLDYLDDCKVIQYCNETKDLKRDDAPKWFEQLDEYARKLIMSGQFDLALYVDD